LNKARLVYQDVLQREPKNVDALLGLGSPALGLLGNALG